ncbi:hypothetical protein J2I47_18630 [Fibrella sp. HMF5335]|uniref:Uncharacterized protein n=1 Tax=Fibrella rubiginis TaxID=2817060 RepID=A0A939K7F7_9BACT|nr:hypothetical protein [Fibrella rubiginis]MBO0938575.1 hypothetical protein [Fibrella rubiginis]
MNNEISFHFINGRFSSEESQPIITAIAEAKRMHHARKMLAHATTEEDMKASETRIKAIEAERRAVCDFLKAVAQRGNTVDIEGSLVVREIERG